MAADSIVMLSGSACWRKRFKRHVSVADASNLAVPGPESFMPLQADIRSMRIPLARQCLIIR
jgi:hypothetical protein